MTNDDCNKLHWSLRMLIVKVGQTFLISKIELAANIFKRSCNQLRWISRAIREQREVRIREREQPEEHIRELGPLAVRTRGRERLASGHPWAGNRPHRQPRSKWISGLRGRSSRNFPCWCYRKHPRTGQLRNRCRTSPWRKRRGCRASSGPETLRGWCSQIHHSCKINREFV